ncbi:MAG: TPM domain-containing protein [Clostridia bacterium]|nr:TPM domain-containing protein [Clostridia bacterium]
MKKLLILSLILCIMALPALADTRRVVDEVNLLSYFEENVLQEKIDEIVARYDMDVAIVTKNDIGYRAIDVYTADYFENAGYGVGDRQDGLIFLIDMDQRNYFTATHGKAITVFTDYGLDQLHNSMVHYLSSGDYYTAFSRYLDKVESYLENYEQTGKAYDVYNAVSLKAPMERIVEMAPIVFIVALGIGLIVAFSLKSQLKTVRKKQNAASYVQKGSFYLSRSQDIYLYTRTTRRKIETNTGGSSHGGRGGSSTFRSSSGRSFGGRGGRF